MVIIKGQIPGVRHIIFLMHSWLDITTFLGNVLLSATIAGSLYWLFGQILSLSECMGWWCVSLSKGAVWVWVGGWVCSKVTIDIYLHAQYWVHCIYIIKKTFPISYTECVLHLNNLKRSLLMFFMNHCFSLFLDLYERCRSNTSFWFYFHLIISIFVVCPKSMFQYFQWVKQVHHYTPSWS